MSPPEPPPPPPTATTAASPPEPEDPPADPALTPPEPWAIHVDAGTVWRDVFDRATRAEQACIRGALGDDLDSLLEEPLMTDADTEEWVASIFGCLTPDNARSLFVASIVAGLGEETGMEEVSGEEMSCLRDAVADLDVAAFMAADLAGEDDLELAEAAEILIGCLPDVFLAAMLADLGVDLDELGEEELSCLREWMSATDWAALAGSEGDFEDLGAFEGLFDLLSCVPGLFDLPDPQPAGPDDHADSADGATPVIVGDLAHGRLDHLGDVDFFTFEAVAGESYRVDVMLASLEDSVLTLYGPDGSELAFNDDRDDGSLASLISWSARASGSHYVAVAGFDDLRTGSYVLSVAGTWRAPGDGAGAPFGDGSLGVVRIERGDAIQIRSLNAISGDLAFFGLPIERALVLAIRDYGPIRGFDVDLGTTLDELCSYDGGYEAAQAIVADARVIGVIGTSCSGAAAAAAPLITAAGMVLVSGGNTAPALTSDLAGTPGPDHSAGYYRTSHNDLLQGVAMARFVRAQLGIDTAAAIHDGDPYTRGLAIAFADAFEALGGTVTGFTAVGHDDTNMVPLLSEIAPGSPGALFFPIFQPAGDFIADQAPRVPGLGDTVLLAADGLLNTDYLSLPQTAGMYFSGPDTRFDGNVNQSTGKTAVDVLDAYQWHYGERPAVPFWAHGYDAATLLLDAITAASYLDGDTLAIDRQGVRDFLNGVEGYSGLTGTIACDDFGDCAAGRITIVRNIGGAANAEASFDNVVYSYAPSGSAAG